MDYRALLPFAVACIAVTSLGGQQAEGGRIFTAEQAAAGRLAYEKTCGRCHTSTLMGREGNPYERPAIETLSEADRKFIESANNRVPPLAGKAFLEHWGSATAAQLVARFQQAKFSFRDAGLTDDEDIVRITAYVLQVNGARAGNQALTRETAAVVNSVVEPSTAGNMDSRSTPR